MPRQYRYIMSTNIMFASDTETSYWVRFGRFRPLRVLQEKMSCQINYKLMHFLYIINLKYEC